MTVGGSRFVVILTLGLTVAATSCGCSFGPRLIEQTHGKYSTSVQRVKEEEFLKNIVRLRYNEEPRNLEVSSIATQYELGAGAEARPFFSTEAAGSPGIFREFARILPFASISSSTRPTISLTPQDDGASVRQFLTPISADTITFLSQSGWPVSNIMRIWMDRINGVPNWVPPSGPVRDKPADFQRFRRVTDLMQQAQDRELILMSAEERIKVLSGPLGEEVITAAATVEAAKAGFEFQPAEAGRTWNLIKREQRVVIQLTEAGRDSPEMAELTSLLNLTAGEPSYELTVGGGVPDPAIHELATSNRLRLTPRSTAQALFFLANGVEIPQKHVECGLVRFPADGTNPMDATSDLFHVHSCSGNRHKPPACAYLAVWYRDHWYYLDDRDADSKATLLLMLQLRQLDFKSPEFSRAPALTLPVGR